MEALTRAPTALCRGELSAFSDGGSREQRAFTVHWVEGSMLAVRRAFERETEQAFCELVSRCERRRLDLDVPSGAGAGPRWGLGEGTA